MVRPSGRFVALALAAFVVACGDDEPTPPSAADVNAVSVTPTSASLTFLGESTSLSATGTADGETVAGLSFNWTSSNTAVASVSGSGEVTAVANGSATVTATVQGGSASGTATITVAQAVSTVDVDEPAGQIAVGATLQLSATAEDQGGAAIATPSLTWSSSDEDVATVDGSGVVTGVDAGTATITAEGGAGSDGVEVTVFREPFTPAADETVSGVIKADDVVIPAGVTITASGPLTIDALGEITLDGDLVGDCVALSVLGGGDVTVTGSVTNACTDASAAGEDLTIAGFGDMVLDGAAIQASGDLVLSNDREFDESVFEPLLASEPAIRGGARAGTPARQAGAHPCDPAGPQPGVCFTIRNGTTVYQGNVQGGAGPGPAMDGDDGQNPTDGADGRRVKLLVQGDADFAGTTTVWGQDAGRGGDGMDTSNTDVAVTGGNGGRGGDIRVLVTGALRFMPNATPPEGESPTNTIRSGAGGRGGDATATAAENAALGAKGPSATATGGNAGGPGLIQVQALGGVAVSDGGLSLQIGQLKRGGNAIANGAPGADATATMAAQEGGDATATGGMGASGPDKQLVRQGNATGNPVIPDAPAGPGGDATAAPGKGGDGLKPNKDGGKGGNGTTVGGTGGDQLLRGIGAAAARIGDGGAGGNLIFTNALGGTGWSDCRDGEDEEPGGNGGAGGNTMAASMQGMGGQGRGPGGDGNTTYNSFGNGGDGGNGTGPGAKGPGGQDNSAAGPKNGLATSFQEGSDGNPCAGEAEQVDVSLTVPGLGTGAVAAGVYDMIATGVASGATEAIIPLDFPNGGFAASDRWGQGPGQDVIVKVDELERPAGGTARLDAVDLCYVNDSASPSNPGDIDVMDADMNLLGSKTYTGVAAAPPAGIPDMPAGNCVRISRAEFALMAYVVVRGLPSGFLDIEFIPTIWLLAIILSSP